MAKKLLDENDPENTIVHVVFISENDPKKEEYESLCVLLKEDADTVTFSFNAKDDVVIDSLVLKRSEIVSIELLDGPIEEIW